MALTPVQHRVPREPAARSGFVWNALLGGAHHHPADRATADRTRRLANLRVPAHASRAFRDRALRHLLGRGLTQVLDLGAGVPTVTGSLHRLLHPRRDSVARLVHVDHDPDVAGHLRRTTAQSGRTTVLHADLTDPAAVLASPEVGNLLDLSQPVVLIATNVFQEIPATPDLHGVLATYSAALVPGSALILSHPVTTHLTPAVAHALDHLFRGIGSRFITRTPAEVTALLGPFTPIPAHPSGATTAVPVTTWSTPGQQPLSRAGTHLYHGAVGILPGPPPERQDP